MSRRSALRIDMATSALLTADPLDDELDAVAQLARLHRSHGRVQAVRDLLALVGAGMTVLRCNHVRDKLRLRLRDADELDHVAQQALRRSALEILRERLQFSERARVDRAH